MLAFKTVLEKPDFLLAQKEKNVLLSSGTEFWICQVGYYFILFIYLLIFFKNNQKYQVWVHFPNFSSKNTRILKS